MTTINNAVSRTTYSNVSQSLLPINGTEQFSANPEAYTLDALNNASSSLTDGDGRIYFINKNEASLKML